MNWNLAIVRRKIDQSFTHLINIRLAPAPQRGPIIQNLASDKYFQEVIRNRSQRTQIGEFGNSNDVGTGFRAPTRALWGADNIFIGKSTNPRYYVPKRHLIENPTQYRCPH